MSFFTRRSVESTGAVDPSLERTSRDRPPHRWRGIVLTALACLFLWVVLVTPATYRHLSPGAFLRFPVEALIFVAIVLLLPRRSGRVCAVIVGALLAVLTVVKLLDLGVSGALGRPFDPVVDWRYAGSAVDLLGDSIGRSQADWVAVGLVILVVALLVLIPLSVLRLTSVVDRHREGSRLVLASTGLVWALAAITGTQLTAGIPVSSTSETTLASDEVHLVYSGIKDEEAFKKVAAVDAYGDTPGSQLLTGLQGKDVLLVFVESYGQVAVQGSSFSPQIDNLLDRSNRRLTHAGIAAKSAFLTSPTFGGISWLAHSTLQSGLWIDNQLRYDDLMSSGRLTLADAFKKAGWRTVSDVPADHLAWPAGTSFYHYDQLYNSLNVGYSGPHFSYAPVPDQYTLAKLQQLELAKRNRSPVMAEVDLVSSHTPWAPLPHMVAWSKLGDGSIFDDMAEQGQSPTEVWRSAAGVQAAYAQSIRYSLRALVSFVTRSHDRNLVMVVLGDHQPAPIVSGNDATHNVPISIIAKDPNVLHKISAWHWQDGLLPRENAPVWPMDSFRDRFLSAYGPQR
jgi:hypothetical protein